MTWQLYANTNVQFEIEAYECHPAQPQTMEQINGNQLGLVGAELHLADSRQITLRNRLGVCQEYKYQVFAKNTIPAATQTAKNQEIRKISLNPKEELEIQAKIKKSIKIQARRDLAEL